MNISIERLHMQLPAGFGHRAESIGRLLGDELARLNWQGDHQLEHLQLSPQEVSHHHSDGQIAGQLAQAIHSQVTNGGDGCSR